MYNSNKGGVSRIDVLKRESAKIAVQQYDEEMTKEMHEHLIQ